MQIKKNILNKNISYISKAVKSGKYFLYMVANDCIKNFIPVMCESNYIHGGSSCNITLSLMNLSYSSTLRQQSSNSTTSLENSY